jgi:hypothetical protein
VPYAVPVPVPDAAVSRLGTPSVPLASPGLFDARPEPKVADSGAGKILPMGDSLRVQHVIIAPRADQRLSIRRSPSFEGAAPYIPAKERPR